jgi:hypothetical protein
MQGKLAADKSRLPPLRDLRISRGAVGNAATDRLGNSRAVTRKTEDYFLQNLTLFHWV